MSRKKAKGAIAGFDAAIEKFSEIEDGGKDSAPKIEDDEAKPEPQKLSVASLKDPSRIPGKLRKTL